jgi:hypothetical protein
MTGPLRFARALWSTFGSEGLGRRVRFDIRSRLTLLHDSAPSCAPEIVQGPPPERWPFRLNAKRLRHHADPATALNRADRVLAGEYEAFRSTWRPLPASGEQWNTNLTTGYRYNAAAPWFRIPHFVSGSDIKDVWEPGRFGWAYDLIRGYTLTRDDRYAHMFWTLLEGFRAGCPPFRGVQWACGQEISIRATALVWADSALAEAPSTTAARQACLRELLWWSAHRIADGLDYAASQRNNHGISECAGLTLLGARFRDADRAAHRWLRVGAAVLEAQVLDQFGRDGWYAQHSITYLRVALDQLVLAERVLRSVGMGLGAAACDRIRAAIDLLATVTDPETGNAPNHGANDGAFVLPLTTRAFRDFRPSLTAAATTFHVALPHPLTADNEVLSWLDADPPPAVAPRARVKSGESGWIDARVGRTRVFARAGVYHSRPSHIDALHLDVHVDARPVAVDAGTYRYVGPWARALAEERAHNTVAIEGHPMALRGPRFLWLRWPRATISSLSDDGEAVVFELLNESWRGLGIEHRRRCRVTAGGVAVVDDVVLPRSVAAPVQVHWLLDGVADNVVIVADAATRCDLREGDDTTPYGWISDSYAVKRPATSVRVTTQAPVTRVRFVSGFGEERNLARLTSLLSSVPTTMPIAKFSRGEPW